MLIAYVTQSSNVKIKFTSSPEMLKILLDKYDSVLVEVDSTENDLTRTCKIGDSLIVKPDRPKITLAKKYVIGIYNKLFFCHLTKESRKKDRLIVFGLGEVPLSDIVIWCHAKRRTSSISRR